MKTVVHTQGSDAWKAWRREGIGGSDVSAILGLSPYTDPPHTRTTVFAEKVHGIEREANFAMNRGSRLEPAARRAYELRHRCSAPPVCVEMDGCPWARVSLDGLCSDGAVPARRIWWILELKCPNWQTHDLALGGCVAEHFAAQCQWQMLVCGIQRLDFASFNPQERFTAGSFPLYKPWQERYAKWLELKHPRAPKRPELIDLWLELPEASRPPMPADWLAEVAVEPDEERQAWILEEVGKFWFEVLEARAAFGHEAGVVPPPRRNRDIEAEFA